MKKNYLWNLLFCIALVSFTVYAVLDTFILKSTYQTNATEQNTAMFSAVQTSEAAENSASENATESSTASNRDAAYRDDSAEEDAESGVQDTADAAQSIGTEESADSENTYQDDNACITLTEYYENNTKIYVADVQLSSAEYLKTAFAEDTYGKNVVEKTSSIAAAHDAILAINGDYYGAQESGYVIRNGVVYRDTASDCDVLCIYADGSMQVKDASENTAEELVADGVWQAFSFGPGLLENGEIAVTQGEEVGKAMASNPRTAIGMISENHYVFVVADGRTAESEGLSLYELAEFMQELGATTAYNLDGGGSSTMYFQGNVVNNPTTNGNHIQEREVSDIVYIG